jgi:hypothetical protein
MVSRQAIVVSWIALVATRAAPTHRTEARPFSQHCLGATLSSLLFGLAQIDIIVRDMAATLAFYRALGWTIETPTAEHGIVARGHTGCQPPYDAFWGSRYAIIEDPDGNRVGLMSPSEESAKFWPPSTPPRMPS